MGFYFNTVLLSCNCPVTVISFLKSASHLALPPVSGDIACIIKVNGLPPCSRSTRHVDYTKIES